MTARRLKDAEPHITAYFDALPGRAFRKADLASHLASHGESWGLRSSTILTRFLRFLQKNGLLRELQFPFKPPYRPTIRYLWKDASLFEAVQLLTPRAYFTHQTAMAFHGLTDALPNDIYLNFEQKAGSNSNGGLAQDRIRNAFRGKPRKTNYVATVDGSTVHVLNGKNTGRIGVVEQMAMDPAGKGLGTLCFTSLERTLIDIVVRPFYAGGPHAVVEAFRRSRDNIAVDSLAAFLEKLAYIYPYHQAIGFYCECAGFAPERLAPLRSIPQEFDFYLTHQMKSPKYVQSWRLYVPSNMIPGSIPQMDVTTL